MSAGPLKIIAEYLVAVYERRGLYDPQNIENRQGVYLYVSKLFRNYEDNFDESYREINEAIEYYRQRGVLLGEKNQRGSFDRLRLAAEKIGVCYELLGRRPLGECRMRMRERLEGWDDHNDPILSQFKEDQLELLRLRKPLDFEIRDDEEKLKNVLTALPKIVSLGSETYIRNFSEAVFSDSKQFQKIRGCIESILCRYGGDELTRDTVLESFNLLDNPSYVMLKGEIELYFADQHIDLGKIPGGIALPSAAIRAVTGARLKRGVIVSVENLTTYHDQNEEGLAVLYLGGFHNEIRTELIRKIYACNPGAEYCHKGDIDVYGFLILENLRDKTGVPFKPLDMDLETLKSFKALGLVKKLEPGDKRLLSKNLPRLEEYRGVLEYMLQNDCKSEQEAEKAVSLLMK